MSVVGLLTHLFICATGLHTSTAGSSVNKTSSPAGGKFASHRFGCFQKTPQVQPSEGCAGVYTVHAQVPVNRNMGCSISHCTPAPGPHNPSPAQAPVWLRTGRFAGLHPHQLNAIFLLLFRGVSPAKGGAFVGGNALFFGNSIARADYREQMEGSVISHSPLSHT